MNQPTSTNRADQYAGTPFRLGHCYELLGEILDRPAVPADLTIGRFFARKRYLGSHDRGFISDTVYGVLRGVLRYHFLLSEDYPRMHPDQETALMLASYLLERGDPVSDDLLRDPVGLGGKDIVLLRERMRDAGAIIAELEEPARTAVRHGMPLWLAGKVLEQMGGEEGERLLDALDTQAPITLRANRLITDRDRLAAALQQQGIGSVPGAYAPDALLLSKRLNANAIPEFKLGWFELQDEGSQLLSTLLDPHPNWKVFDPCAGAGGKALHMAAIMRGRGSITAHDLNTRRLMEIRPRLRRSGAQNIRVLTHDEYQSRRRELLGSFDAVMIDAPCSGAGVLRRTPGARLTMDEAMIDRLVVQQEEILQEYSAMVKPGGLLLYATCSLLREEDEAQVERFLAANSGWSVQTPTAPADMITPDNFFRCYPHRHGTDAFFGALLRRGG